MRLILFTGKGGAGTTTLASATAVHAARAGHKTVMLSTNRECSLADALGADLASDGVTEVEPGLFLQNVDAQAGLERSWPQVAGYLGEQLKGVGDDPIEADEIAVLPGIDQVLSLLALRERLRSGRWDVVVVDAGPAAQALRLLALPETLGWYARRLMPSARGMAHALVRLHEQMADARSALTDAGASVRLVLTPERVAVAETRRTLTALSLYGYRVDAVVANRLLPAGGADSWRTGWVGAQAAVLTEVERSFGPLPVLRAGYRAGEPVGVDELAALAAEVYAGTEALAEPAGGAPMTVERTGDEFVLSLALPLATRSGLRLSRAGDDLVVTVGAHRRVLTLPSVLRRCDVVGARLTEGRLRIRFQPDPALWRGL